MNVNNLANYSLELLGTSKETAKGVALPTPDYSRYDFNTKTAPAMSDEAYKEAIVEQAKKDAAKGVAFNTKDPNYLALRKSYISVASPDRKNTIAEAIKNLMRTSKGTVNFLSISTKSGEEIASYSKGRGWHMIQTSAEVARGQSFYSTYKEAWDNARAEIEGKFIANA